MFSAAVRVLYGQSNAKHLAVKRGVNFVMRICPHRTRTSLTTLKQQFYLEVSQQVFGMVAGMKTTDALGCVPLYLVQNCSMRFNAMLKQSGAAFCRGLQGSYPQAGANLR